MKAFENSAVADVFQNYPPIIRDKLLFLRQLIFDTAAKTSGVGKLQETLKWGEPAYLTSQSKSGSTIRIDWKKSNKTEYAMYFHCQTRLIDTFRTLFPTEFKYQGTRAIVFQVEDIVPIEQLVFCISLALTYHRDRTKNRESMKTPLKLR